MANDRKIEVQEKADFTYTNPVAMPDQVGGYEPGTTFSAKTLKQMFDGLLYPYQYPAFTSFLISGQATTLECGVEIAAGNHTFNWGASNSDNINVNSLIIRDVTNAVDLATGLANDGSETINFTSAITKLVTNQTHQWKISGVNTNGDTFDRTFTVRWYSPFYYGVGAKSLTVSQIQSLTKQVVSKSDKTYSFSPTNEVFYFAYPSSYGELSSILDANGFETISDWTKRTESFTNNSPNYEGGTVEYYVYEFNNLTTQSNFNNTFKF